MLLFGASPADSLQDSQLAMQLSRVKPKKGLSKAGQTGGLKARGQSENCFVVFFRFRPCFNAGWKRPNHKTQQRKEGEG